MARLRIFAVIWPVFFLLSGPASAKTLVIPGSGDPQALLRALAPVFEQRHPGIRVEIPESIGSSGGIRLVSEGRAQLARIARPLREREQTPGLHTRVFALSPVVFAANLPAGCLEDLSGETILAIFSGKVRDWSALGSCPPHKIYVANREEGDSSRTVLEKTLPGFAAIAEPEGKVIYSTPETVGILLECPYTIGYVPYAMVRKSSLAVFRLNGIAPLEANYPMVSPLALVWKGEPDQEVARFLDFLQTPEARAVIREYGALPAPGP